MIQVKNVTKSFGSQVVLDNVSLHCERERSTVILGRSGQGKSVLMKHFLGLLRPDSGDVLIDNKSILNFSRTQMLDLRKRFGYLFQDGALFDDMTVFENVSFPLREHTDYPEEKISECVNEKLALVGLENVESKMPSELSGGMRKRVALARAVVLNPEILLFDEPVTGLDPVMKKSVLELIYETKEKLKVTTVVITHDIRSSLFLADHLIVVDEGRIIFDGDVAGFEKSSIPLIKDFIKFD